MNQRSFDFWRGGSSNDENDEGANGRARVISQTLKTSWRAAAFFASVGQTVFACTFAAVYVTAAIFGIARCGPSR